MADIKQIDSLDELDALFEQSYSEPVIIFKHSNSCGISSHVLDMASGIDGELNVVVVQQYRDLSNEIARRTGYTHQSPQAFVLVDGKPVYHATHYGIDPKAISNHLLAVK